jgi:hypothetical protein
MSSSFRLKILFAAAAIAGAAGCSADSSRDPRVRAFGSDIEGARSEVWRHHHVVARTSDLEELQSEVERHGGEMGAFRGRMSIRMDGMMSHCAGSGMDPMHGMMEVFDAEVRAHRDEVGGAPTLEEARSRCAAYTDGMQVLLSEMHEALGGVGCMMR